MRALRCSSMTNTYSNRRGGDIRLMAEFGELGFGGRVGDTDGGPVVKELAGRGMLGDGFERGAVSSSMASSLNLRMERRPRRASLLRW